MADSRDITGKNRKFTGTTGIKLPTGTEAQRVDESAQIRFNTDTNLAEYYDGTVSREVNFRPGDLSSVFNSSKAIKYLRQLWMKDGQNVEERIENENPILFLTTHQLLSCMGSAFKAFGERLKIIEMVRHPLYLLDHWESYIMMHGKNVRDFTVWLDESGESVPWFAQGWEQKYIESSSYDRVVYSIEVLMQDIFKYAKSEARKDSIIFIPFEKFVLNPDPYTRDLENFLGAKMRPATRKILKKQRVPRPSINAGPQKSIYKRYALKAYDKNVSHQEDFQNKIDSAKKNCSGEAYKVLEKLSKEYEDVFGLWF